MKHRRTSSVIAIYLALALAGTLLPLSAFIPWFVEYGFDPTAFFRELFSTRIGSFFGWDVIISALVLSVFILHEGRRERMRHLWAPIVATLLIGVSCGLPLFLALRERELSVSGRV